MNSAECFRSVEDRIHLLRFSVKTAKLLETEILSRGLVIDFFEFAEDRIDIWLKDGRYGTCLSCSGRIVNAEIGDCFVVIDADGASDVIDFAEEIVRGRESEK